MSTRVVPDATCLGCGLACDDVAVTLEDGRIAAIAPPCPVGREWFGDGRVPAEIRVGGTTASFDTAVRAAVDVLAPAEGRVVVVLAPGLVTSAVRAGIAIADRLRARVDTATSAGAAEGILAGQRRGRASSTLGEVKNRSDIVLFWAVDPTATHPRFLERLVAAPGSHVQGERTLLAVRVGEESGPSAAHAIAVDPAHEAATLGLLRGLVLGQVPTAIAELADLLELAQRLLAGRYVTIVGPGESTDARRSALRSEGLIALAQALNGPTRCTLITLRAGGNRNGVESALSWQSGYPFAVDYATGAPRYDPGARGMTDLWRTDAALVLGDWRALPNDALGSLGQIGTVVIGARASDAPFAPRVAIDTGIAGIHEGGVAYRMDDVPLPLTPVLDGARTASMAITALAEALGPRGGRG